MDWKRAEQRTAHTLCMKSSQTRGAAATWHFAFKLPLILLWLLIYLPCCGCPTILPGCPLLCVSSGLSLMDSCSSGSWNHRLSPSFPPDCQARSSLHLCIIQSIHQCWISISSWCQISAQPTALASWAGKPSYAPDFARDGCREAAVLFILYLMSHFFSSFPLLCDKKQLFVLKEASFLS